MGHLKHTKTREAGQDVTLPVHRVLATEVEDALQWIAEYAGREIAREPKDDGVLRHRAILILIDVNATIGCAHDPADERMIE